MHTLPRRYKRDCLNSLIKSPRATARLKTLTEWKSFATTLSRTPFAVSVRLRLTPVLATLKFFRDEYVAHVTDKVCPAGVCKDLVSYSIIADKCEGLHKVRP